MGRHFACTACGKCCHGWLPLTIGDALAHASRFPLAMVWTPVRKGHKAFALTLDLGTTLRLPDRREVALRLTPTAYLPPAFPCPALTRDNLCAIHADKPLRCRTMPFFPAFPEADQAAHLIPRPGWSCDVSPTAPEVYRDGRIVIREDFDRERAALRAQAPVLRAYAAAMRQTTPALPGALAQAMAKPGGGEVVLSFATLLPHLAAVDPAALAGSQLAVLAELAARTAEVPQLAAYHRDYTGWVAEWQRVARRAEARR